MYLVAREVEVGDACVGDDERVGGLERIARQRICEVQNIQTLVNYKEEYDSRNWQYGALPGEVGQMCPQASVSCKISTL